MRSEEKFVLTIFRATYFLHSQNPKKTFRVALQFYKFRVERRPESFMLQSAISGQCKRPRASPAAKQLAGRVSRGGGGTERLGTSEFRGQGPHVAAETHISAWADWALDEADTFDSVTAGGLTLGRTNPPIALVKEVRR
jgi:hypothetical protein